MWLKVIAIHVACMAICGVAAASAEMPAPEPLLPELHDSHADHAQGWCVLHIARGELGKALADCNLAVAQRPDSARALSNRGSLYLLAGAFAKALPDFDDALKLAPDDFMLYFSRGFALGKLGQGSDAIAAYSEAIRLNPDFAIAYHNRGCELELKRRYQEALRDYRAALHLDRSLTPSRHGIMRLTADL